MTRTYPLRGTGWRPSVLDRQYIGDPMKETIGLSGAPVLFCNHHSLMKTPGLGSKRLCFGPLSVPPKNDWLESFPERLCLIHYLASHLAWMNDIGKL